MTEFEVKPSHPQAAAVRPRQGAVLVISDDAEFARTVVARWQMERNVPAFTLIGSQYTNGSLAAHRGLIIVGPVGGGKLQKILSDADPVEAASTLLLALDGESAHLASDSYPRILVVRQNDGWVDHLVVLGTEALRCQEAFQRARQAESVLAESSRHATLGRYMIEMRHSCNNALTSILGNSELLLLEPGVLSADVREQIETIHTMSLRLHEILQRFSSIESEMQFAERSSQPETTATSQPLTGRILTSAKSL